MFIYNKPGIPCIWNNLLEHPNQQTESTDHLWNAHQQTQILNTHLWKTHLEQTLEHTSGAHLSPVCSMSLPRKKGCCLASVHKLSLNPMEVITRIGHAIPDRGPGRPPSRRTNASGLPFPPSLLAAALWWQTPRSLLYAQRRQRPLPLTLAYGLVEFLKQLIAYTGCGCKLGASLLQFPPPSRTFPRAVS